MQFDSNSFQNVSTSLNTTPDEIIAQIFSWITPLNVFKFRRLNTRVDCILRTAHFAVLNQTKFDAPIRDELKNCVKRDIARLGDGFSGTFAMAPYSFRTVYTRRYLGLLKSLCTGIEWTLAWNLTPVFSKSLCEFDWVEDFYIGGVCGPIPREISRFTLMKRLRILYIIMDGVLAREVWGLVQLMNLDVSFCRLTGILPHECTRLIALVSLNLSNNLLEGPLPANLGDLRNLVYLNFSSNRVSGPLPESIKNLVKLQELFLQSNMFTGTVPETFGNFTAINRINEPQQIHWIFAYSAASSQKAIRLQFQL
ncbi:hypothetical protein BDR26DRAFT_867795 [Obelidium mucronatum]|nr:hypothetical protein BDR26DRAFT_867795 [Obelidium mucronatum]